MTEALSFAALPDFALLEVSGPDSERFLQGQLTCDVAALPDLHWTLGACCTAKGRMVANFVILRTNDIFLLRLPKYHVSALATHLSKYAVFFKTTLTEHLVDWQIVGSQEEDTVPQLLEAPRAVTESAEGFSFTWPDGRSEQWLRATNAELPINQQWKIADIKQGLVWVTEASKEQWIPQNIDWHQQGGVSFNKGCYTGQEIVARLQYLGKSKKKLVQISSGTELDINVLDPVLNAEGKTVGEVTSWHIQQGLAYINDDEQGELMVNDQLLSVTQLFYTDEHVK